MGTPSRDRLLSDNVTLDPPPESASAERLRKWAFQGKLIAEPRRLRALSENQRKKIGVAIREDLQGKKEEKKDIQRKISILETTEDVGQTVRNAGLGIGIGGAVALGAVTLITILISN